MSAPLQRVGVVTTSRADFGIYRSVLDALGEASDLDFGLFVSGMHLSPEFGMTAELVRQSGHPIWDMLEAMLSSDSDIGVAKSMGLTTMAFADSLGRTRPDLLLVLGDRFEMHAAALAAVPLGIPLAHIHGGEETEGAIDNVLRHSLTKLSSLHFPATELSARRIRSMGEDQDRIIVAGAPALDGVEQLEPLPRAVLAERFGLPPEGGFILATYHPVTLSPQSGLEELEQLWIALSDNPQPVVFTMANADAAGRAVNARLGEMARDNPKVTLVGTMGAQGYFSTMREARVMIGNSSSGIIEAASFGLPVVNVGDRQKGRERSANVIDAPGEAAAIRDALAQAQTAAFRDRARRSTNIYGDGKSAQRIAKGISAFLRAGEGASKRFAFEKPQ